MSVNSYSSARQSLAEDLALWDDLGIDLVALDAVKATAFGWDATVAAVENASLRISTVIGPPPPPAGSEEAVHEAARAEVMRAIDFAAAVSSPSVYVVSGAADGFTWEEAAERFAAWWRPVNEHARAHGVVLAIEPTNALRADIGFVFTLRDALRLAREADMAAVGELQCCWLEPDLASTVREHIDRVALVQVSDFVLGTADTPNRAVPGDGCIPLERLIGMFLDAGYAGPFDLELIGPRIEAEGYRSAIRRGVDRLSDLLDRLGA